MIWLPVAGNYADIDVYASIIAYADLLNQRGKAAKTYIPVAPNYSVPKALRLPKWENATFNLQPSDEVIILDISIPEEIAKFAPDSQILELIDHHPGYEDYWHERIGDKAIIEKIGAVATSIFEWWGECWDYNKMSPQTAKLLLGAILDNTLNFTAQITTERDHQAATQLSEIADTTLADFTTWYFSEVNKTIISDLKNALLQDCKTVVLPTNQSKFTFCQLTLWDAKDITAQQDRITQIMNNAHPAWLVSVICISENKNYLIASSPEIRDYLTRLLNLEAEGNWLTSSQLHLRKEIIAKMLKK
jgi:inorganic pyrophosphatase/exopolyphosphatase